MERLTKHSELTGSPVPSNIIGDICMKINFCNEFDFCTNCPIRELINRLCAYEDTRYEPEEIIIIKKIFGGENCHQKPIRIIDKPKSSARIFTTRVTPNGIIIDNILYGIRDLIDGHCNEKVKVRVFNDVATVFDIETGEQIIWFELYLHKGINCKHSFYPYKTEYGDTPDMIQKAIDEVSAKVAKKFKEKIQNLYIEQFGSVNEATNGNDKKY